MDSTLAKELELCYNRYRETGGFQTDLYRYVDQNLEKLGTFLSCLHHYEDERYEECKSYRPKNRRKKRPFVGLSFVTTLGNPEEILQPNVVTVGDGMIMPGWIQIQDLLEYYDKTYKENYMRANYFDSTGVTYSYFRLGVRECRLYKNKAFMKWIHDQPENCKILACIESRTPSAGYMYDNVTLPGKVGGKSALRAARAALKKELGVGGNVELVCPCDKQKCNGCTSTVDTAKSDVYVFCGFV